MNLTDHKKHCARVKELADDLSAASSMTEALRLSTLIIWELQRLNGVIPRESSLPPFPKTP